MDSIRHLAWFFAAALLIALSAMPSRALAHAGAHVHQARLAVTTIAPQAHETDHALLSDEAVPPSAAASPQEPASSDSGCVGGCCLCMAACCGMALLPAWTDAPAIALSTAFAVFSMRAVQGLPPEALPKPPKSFA